jgi:phage-related protein
MATPVEILINGRDNSGSAFASAGSGLAKIGQIAAGILASQVFQKVASAAVDFATSSITAASNYSETLNKSSAIFGDASNAMLQWSQGSAQAVGLSATAALDAAGMFGIFGKAAGLAGDDLAKFSQDNVGLAADMASFFNTSVEEAATSIQAAFRGETEPIRKYGVLLDDASMRQEALAMGIVSTTKQALTPQQKILAANALLWKQTEVAQGDFIKTSDGFANQQRIFNAQIENAKIQLGTAFLPMITKVMTFFNTTAIPVLQGIIANVTEMVNTFVSLQDEGFTPFEAFLQILTKLTGVRFDLFQTTITDTFNAFLPSIQSAIKTFDQMRPTLEKVAATLGGKLAAAGKELSSKVFPFLVTTMNKFSVWLAQNRPLIEAFAVRMGAAFANIAQALVAFWSVVQPILGGLMDLIMGLATLVMQVFTGDWAGAWQTAQTTVENVFDAIGVAIVAALEFIANMMGGSLAGIKAQWTSNWNALKSILTQVWAIIKSTVNTALLSVKTYFTNTWASVVSSVSNFASGLRSAISSAISGAVSAALGALGGFFSIGSRIIDNIVTGLKNGTAYMINYLKQVIANLIGNIFGGGTSGGGGGGNGFNDNKALGGNVYAGRGYTVGEVGRELFVPATNGTIIPNNKLGVSGNSSTYNNYYNAHVTVYTGKTEQRQSMRGFI